MDATLKTLLARAIGSAADGILVADHSSSLTWVNKAVCAMRGYGREVAVGNAPRLFNSGKPPPEFFRLLRETALSGNTYQGGITERHKNGARYVVQETNTPVCNTKGGARHFVACSHPVDYSDNLTSLPDRNLFYDVICRAFDHARCNHGLLALMYIDLDCFKQVNDLYGHAIGDRLLCAVGARLRSAIRKCDWVARLGGDEFIVLLTAFDDPYIPSAMARKLIAKISQPYSLDGRRIEIGASIGISRYPRDGTAPEVLVNCADEAMYAAKLEGSNCFKFFAPAV